eukprot:1069062-Prorocentrum_minimum.AAC.1
MTRSRKESRVGEGVSEYLEICSSVPFHAGEGPGLELDSEAHQILSDSAERAGHHVMPDLSPASKVGGGGRGAPAVPVHEVDAQSVHVGVSGRAGMGVSQCRLGEAEGQA